MVNQMKRVAVIGWCLTVWVVPSLAYDVTIDTFGAFVNTGAIDSNFGVPNSASDTGLVGVLGGSRDLLVQTDPLQLLVTSGVKLPGILDYMSIGTGFSEVTYTGGTAGLGASIACAEAVEVVYFNADDAAQGLEGGGAVLIALTLTGGASVTQSQAVTGAAATLSFPLADFAGVDLQNLTSIALRIDGSNSDSADLAVDSIQAVGCEAPPAPAPSMGMVPLALSTLMLVGLGMLGMKRRRNT